MKKRRKKQFAFVMAVLLFVGTVGTAVLTRGKEVCAVENRQEPMFMAKMSGTHIEDRVMHTYVNVYQSVKPVSGATYILRCRYYDRTGDGNGTLYLSSNTSVQLEEADLYGRLSNRTKTGTEGDLELTYTAGAEDTSLTVSLECDPDSECYFWDVTLTSDQTGETNLLMNGDFSAENGSWIGWSVKGEHITDIESSQVVNVKYGHEIVAYDRAFIEKMKAEDAVRKDYEDPNLCFSTEDVEKYSYADGNDDGYMAKLLGTYVDENGVERTWAWVNQAITPKAGVTYQLKYEYYVSAGNASGVIWSDTVEYDKGPMFQMKEQERGTAEIEYTAVDNDTWISIRFECAPESICYIKNVQLSEKNSSNNLLKNGDFSTGNGSWIGWSVGGQYVSDKETSDEVSVTYGREILNSDPTFFIREEKDYMYTTAFNAADRLNPQSGGADGIAESMRVSIMNEKDCLAASDGTVYYISSRNGNDNQDGKSPNTAWKTIAAYREHSAQIQAGDIVLFERGGVYRGEIIERTVLPLISGVNYGAYGVGAKPAIYGSKQNYIGLGSWKKTDKEHIWMCSEEISSDAGCMVFNHGQAVGVKRLKESDMKSNFEFYHDLDTKTLYLYMDCNPALNFYDIEICENSYMVLGNAGSHDIQIDNLTLKYSGGHAVRFHPDAENISITNCEIGFIGGSLQLPGKNIRYGNGIEFWNGCKNLTIKNNWIYQIYDAGFTHQGGADAEGGCYTQEQILFAGNLVEYCSFSLEYWAGNPDKDVLKNITYENNVVRFNGYGWGMLRPDTNGVASINAWGHTETFYAEDFVIRNNIFDLSTKALIFSHYTEEPNVVFCGNSYYQKEGYVAFWEGKTYLAATDQSTMEASVAEIDKEAKEVCLISNNGKENGRK